MPSHDPTNLGTQPTPARTQQSHRPDRPSQPGNLGAQRNRQSTNPQNTVCCRSCTDRHSTAGSLGQIQERESRLDQQARRAQTVCPGSCQHPGSSEGPLGEAEKAAENCVNQTYGIDDLSSCSACIRRLDSRNKKGMKPALERRTRQRL